MADYNSKYTGAEVEGLLDKVDGIPTPTSSDNGKVLGVSNGLYALLTPSTIYWGTQAPSSGTGLDGDIYIQT